MTVILENTEIEAETVHVYIFFKAVIKKTVINCGWVKIEWMLSTVTTLKRLPRSIPNAKLNETLVFSFR